MLFVSEKKIWGKHALFRDDKVSIWKKRHTLLCILLFFGLIVTSLSLEKVWLPPISFLDFNSP